MSIVVVFDGSVFMTSSLLLIIRGRGDIGGGNLFCMVVFGYFEYLSSICSNNSWDLRFRRIISYGIKANFQRAI